MYDIGPAGAQCRSKVAVGLAAPDDPGRQRRLLRHRPVCDLVAGLLEAHDLVPRRRKRGTLLVHDLVLPARRGRTIAIVDLQNLHSSNLSDLVGTTSDAARVSSRSAIEASLRPVAVIEVTRR